MKPERMEASGREQGFVLVAVLWILMALSVLALVFSFYLSASARSLALDNTTLQAEALVSASVELSAYQLALAGDDKRPPRGTFDFRMDDATVFVSFTSEAARIDLNLSSKDVLAGLFAGLGANQAAASYDADRIIGWRTRPGQGDNSEAALYQAAGLNYPPRQALFTHAGELALVVGLPPALVDRALPFVTVFNGTTGIDATIAAPEVLAASGASDQPKDPFSGPPAQPNDAAEKPAPDALTAKSTCYRIETTINFRNGRRTRSEVVIALGDKVEPYHVLAWQDDVEIRDRLPQRRVSP